MAAAWTAIPLSLSLSIAGAEPQPAPAAGGFTDLMPAFWKVYDGSVSLDTDPRVRRLMTDFFEPHSAAYRLAGLSVTPERVLRWLPKFDLMAEEVRQLHRRFPALYAAQCARFQRALPDFKVDASPIWLLPSLFSFDAHLESQGPNAPLPLFFGADGIQRWHGSGADPAVLFAHEFFHCYHAQRAPRISLEVHSRVHESLWVEGLATYASEQLNPGASLVQLLLDDEKLAAADPATLRRAAAALLDVWDSTEASAAQPFFDMGHHGDWPSRIGYYVGLLAARQLGRKASLQQLAGWDRGALSDALRPAVLALAQ
ncbi:hypothetical protein CDN98_14870 [Roseateles terrae]|nr:hypothetical protein CDN98_14870 [Roseateles terrae]